ncbi:unnamed protein product [Medioppia subpectinata]|uniref:Uncharacterized protein n=1 Tax=Medioppia subpectinata TaxID=1979941 RepID=A0A7R9PTU7_9ACAR|nr:unnamed protein product [Medioppia subpectinata]CAG2100822.1 unnamed protein product [Medioppia subpectinata]
MNIKQMRKEVENNTTREKKSQQNDAKPKESTAKVLSPSPAAVPQRRRPSPAAVPQQRRPSPSRSRSRSRSLSEESEPKPKRLKSAVVCDTRKAKDIPKSYSNYNESSAKRSESRSNRSVTPEQRSRQSSRSYRSRSRSLSSKHSRTSSSSSSSSSASSKSSAGSRHKSRSPSIPRRKGSPTPESVPFLTDGAHGLALSRLRVVAIPRDLGLETVGDRYPYRLIH